MNGKIVIDFEDKRYNDLIDDSGKIVKRNLDTGNILNGGRIGIRQMSELKAEYSNFRIYQINCVNKNNK
ncbi:MAG: hypothetical protein A2Y10_19985 [Planctomycetes bacterium GWF2_41_51]|nr:MAG: hypothetical protein A2Y10_19985 [Planctomycetes bacterium GWF2_41_51]HBG28568.1 hypothetical protein [Phycisphaerales bacterium]